jgi:hypothetical protein
MLQAIIGAVGGFIFGAIIAMLVMVTIIKTGPIGAMDKEAYFFAGFIGGGALAGPCAVIGATSAILNAMRARARGYVD